jgi:hypothetical protein
VTKMRRSTPLDDAQHERPRRTRVFGFVTDVAALESAHPSVRTTHRRRRLPGHPPQRAAQARPRLTTHYVTVRQRTQIRLEWV